MQLIICGRFLTMGPARFANREGGVQVKRVTVLCLGVWVLAAALLPAQEAGADEAAIRRAIGRVYIRWAEAFKKQNASLFYQVFSDDGVFMGAAGRPASGPEMVAKVMSSNMELLGPAETRFTTQQVFLVENQVYETGLCAYTFGPRDQRQTTRGRYVAVWKKVADGSWRIHRFVALPEN
jgi:uncharacterized protein (TIGR02246 family)